MNQSPSPKRKVFVVQSSQFLGFVLSQLYHYSVLVSSCSLKLLTVSYFSSLLLIETWILYVIQEPLQEDRIVADVSKEIAIDGHIIREL